MSATTTVDYVPFDVSRYERSKVVLESERAILSNRQYRSDRAYLQSRVPGLVNPLIDLITHSGVSDRLGTSSVAAIL